MAKSECKPQTFVDEATPREDVSSRSSSSIRRSIDRSPVQGQYVDVDLGASSQWDRVSIGKRLQKSVDSQEFEFDMPGCAPNVMQPTQVAPADELFYKGQLLPLQPDPRLHLVQSLCSEEDSMHREMSSRLIFSSFRDQEVKFRSCRMEAVGLDTSLMDLRCSSFRSQNSGYWESGDKDTGDSSSSRDSNGSSQDSYFSGDKEVLRSSVTGQAAKLPGHWKRKPAFNWKSFFGGLKKASRVWGDERVEHSGERVAQSADLGRQKLAGVSSSSLGRPSGNLAANGASVVGLKRISSSKLRAYGNGEEIKELRAPGGAGSNGGRGDLKSAMAMGSDKHRSWWHSRERWQAYAKKLKPLYSKVSQKQAGSSRGLGSMDDFGKACGAVESNTRPFERRLSQPSIIASLHDSLACSSARFLTIASCPASIRSSPNHSGVLAVVNKSSGSSNMSTMQELHSAVQGAIAHCKESIARKPDPTPISSSDQP